MRIIFSRNLIDLISQNDMELMNSTITSKIEQAKGIAENKLTNYIENYRYKFKSSKRLCSNYLNTN